MTGAPAPWPHGRSRDGGIDEIPLVGTAGRMWLCGKHVVGPDPEAALARVGADTLVCLVERFELEPRYPEAMAWIEAHHGGRALWWPIPDISAPSLASTEAMVAELRLRLDRGARTVVHCGAGVGRAGTLAAAVLVDLGLGVDEALEVVRSNRPMGGPQAADQLALLHAFATGR
jgi:protein-tyrosine phosphatase